MSRAKRRKWRPFRAFEKQLKRLLMALAVVVLPRVYLGYMWLVWKTSRIERIGYDPRQVCDHYRKLVVAIWHDEVFFVAWAWRHVRPATLASRGDFGALITRMLELCDFDVFRGGSSTGHSRHAPDVLRDMIEHMTERPDVLYGITVDGSNGPRYRMKKGAPRIAVACEAPMMVQKTWCKRHLRLPTWDRTLVPLPFNHIVSVFCGPFAPPRDANTPDGFFRFSRRIEDALLDVTWYARTLAEGSSSADLLEGFPAHWKPPTAPLALERPFEQVVVDPPLTGDSSRQ